MAILPKLTYKFNAVPVKKKKTSWYGFFWNWKAEPKTHMEIQMTQDNLYNLGKEENIWRNYIYQFQNLHKAAVIKTVLSRCKNRHMDQGNKIESLEINPYIYGPFSTRVPRQFNGGKTSLSSNWISTCKWMKLDFYLIPYA